MSIAKEETVTSDLGRTEIAPAEQWPIGEDACLGCGILGRDPVALYLDQLDGNSPETARRSLRRLAKLLGYGTDPELLWVRVAGKSVELERRVRDQNDLLLTRYTCRRDAREDEEQLRFREGAGRHPATPLSTISELLRRI